MIKSRKPYPYEANFDDQIAELSPEMFYIFAFTNEQFSWQEISPKKPFIEFADKKFELKNGIVHVDDYQISENLVVDDLIIRRADLMRTFTIMPPHGINLIADDEAASIKIKGKATAIFTAIFNKNGNVDTYELRMRAMGERVYYNGQLLEKFDDTFMIGDKLLIGGIHIERRPKQFKITSISGDVDFNPRKIKQEALIPEYPIDFPDYRRSPRILKKPPVEVVKITPPKRLEKAEKGALLKTILPPLTMVIMSVIIGIFTGGNLLITAATSATALVTAVFTVSAYFTSQKEIATTNAKRDEDYELYLFSKEAELGCLERAARVAAQHHFPSMELLAEMMHDYSPRLYEKTVQNADFLEISLGIGTGIPSYKIEYDVGADPDELTKLTQEVVDGYRILENTPILAQLQRETIGFIGINSVLKTVVKTVLFQLATFHSYKDVEFIALVPREDFTTDFKPWRWLPHFKIGSLNLRGLVHNERTRDMVLNSFYQLITKRKNELAASNQELQFSPHYVLTILDDSYLTGHGLNEYLAEDMSKYGVTVIWCKEAQALLPETVTTMAEYHSIHAGVLVNKNGEFVNKSFTPYQLPKQIPAPLAISRLANLNHVEVEKNAIPKMVTFLDMYKAKKIEDLNVLSRWDKANSSKSLAVPLGLRGRDDIVELNLHERAHGPHGLVAGTTGSGKSEIVQSYILSLAVNFPPEDFGFLIIDFKGGGMANEFANLPHLMGAITNLDGAASARALASIQAELKKRQSEFGKYGVNHINGYTKLYKKGKTLTAEERNTEGLPDKPIPHLFLISDEFAELKANEPEFMAELVSVARIGRSLGVHLILATQKPSGVVDDQIWSNSRFKLALKVADESDSNEIIKTPDAARISEPGRAYLQVGNNEIYELFQSAWSGADYEPNKTEETQVDDRVWLINDLGQYELLTLDSNHDNKESAPKKADLPTELRAIVDYIDILVTANNIIIPDKPWLAPLSEEIIMPKIMQSKHRDLRIDIGEMDLPDQQKQMRFTFDFEEQKHTAIYGSSGFGKSTLLQTIALGLAKKNTPMQLQFNLFDFGTNGLLPLKNLPHTVDYTRAEDDEKLEKFLQLICAEIATRKELFTKTNVASLAQYEAKTGKTLPIIITMIDAYDNIKENQKLVTTLDELLGQLLRDGANLGLYLLITALRPSALRMNLSGNIQTKIALFFNDENDLMEIVGRERLAQQEIQGRAQIKIDAVRSIQLYLPMRGMDDFERLQNLDEEVATIDKSWTGNRPKSIPTLPKEFDLEWFTQQDATKEWLANGNLPLGLSTATTEIRGYQPKEQSYFLIADNDPDQTEYLRSVILNGFKQLGSHYHRVLVDRSGVLDSHEVFDEIINPCDLTEQFFEEMSQKKLALFYICDIIDFTNNVSLSTEDFAQIIRTAKDKGIHFIFHGDKSKINGFDNITKQLQLAKHGLVGSRMADQNFVRVVPNFSEPHPEHNEHHYFNGRFIEKIKLPIGGN